MDCIRDDTIEYRDTTWLSSGEKYMQALKNKKLCQQSCEADSRCSWWKYDFPRCSHLHDKKYPDSFVFKRGSHSGRVGCKNIYNTLHIVYYMLVLIFILAIGLIFIFL